MTIESKGIPESIHPLRQELLGMNSPLAKKVAEEMNQDRSLERIDEALNYVGESLGTLNVVREQKDVEEVFGMLKNLTDLEDVKEIKDFAQEIKDRINQID